MRRFLLIILAVICVFSVYNRVNANEVIIPDTAIRLRVIPNSNSGYDIVMKEKVRVYLENEVYNLFENVDTLDEARNVIDDNIDNINDNIQKIFKDNNYKMDFDVNFGNNYFPLKEYNGIKYPEGYYESLVVSIGEARGDNFWCVLFPTFCLLDSKEHSKAEYKFFVKELIDKYF